MEQQKKKQCYGIGVSVDKSADMDKYFDTIPPGYRFCPKDSELILDYLKEKVMNRPLPPNRIKEVNLKDYSPQDLIEKYYCKAYREKEWYFFTPRDRKYLKGDRPDRAAGDGFWRATEAKKPVRSNGGTLVGYKRSLVYYKGKPPNGKKTNWLMNEYSVSDNVILTYFLLFKTFFMFYFHHSTEIDFMVRYKLTLNYLYISLQLDDCVLCRIHKKADKEVAPPLPQLSLPPPPSSQPPPPPLPPSPPPPPPPAPTAAARSSHDDSTVLLVSEQADPFPDQVSAYRPFDQSFGHRLFQPHEELPYGITNNSQNHVGFGHSMAQNRISCFHTSMTNMNSSNQPSLPFVGEQLPASSMSSSVQYLDNQQGTTQLFSLPFISTQLPASSMPSSVQYLESQQGTTQLFSLPFISTPLQASSMPSSLQILENQQSTSQLSSIQSLDYLQPEEDNLSFRDGNYSITSIEAADLDVGFFDTDGFSSEDFLMDWDSVIPSSTLTQQQPSPPLAQQPSPRHRPVTD
ncbi:hypothetical protein HHK36_019715 [Tetracentron sinense]|uniref:NAC domain-containing protein n=1 Tax=Tetracentron sinense TaxID=13715 RepID=A0A835DD08_TETSI|nr:hypothetical protein HHK36_019715 [Tetracentron sinense]